MLRISVTSEFGDRPSQSEGTGGLVVAIFMACACLAEPFTRAPPSARFPVQRVECLGDKHQFFRGDDGMDPGECPYLRFDAGQNAIVADHQDIGNALRFQCLCENEMEFLAGKASTSQLNPSAFARD